ncbi:MAG: hypothetical protein J7497_06860 [Chitinophagaceae bacterium]|nr:hypothetical protein [Chitinophagaceae bacterium]
MYNPIFFRLLLLLAIFTIAACRPTKPMVSNLHKGPYKYEKAPADILKVSVGILPIIKPETEPEKPRIPWDFRDSIPHLLIKTLYPKAKDAEDFIATMSKPIPTTEKKVVKTRATDFTEYKVLMTFSNIKRYFKDSRFMHPNTRLEFLNTILTLDNTSRFSFYNIDKLVNEFDEIDLGSLEHDQTATFNAKLTANGELGSSLKNTNTATTGNNNVRKKGTETPVFDAKGEVVGTVNSAGEFTSTSGTNNTSELSNAAKATVNGEVGYLNTESIKEIIAVKLKRMKTGFSFSKDELVIAQRGRTGGDISDNVYITATLKFTNNVGADNKDVYAFENLFGEKNELTAPDKLIFSMRNVRYVKCDAANAVKLKTSYEGVVRSVGNEKCKTGESVLEYDDHVTFYHIDSTQGATLDIDANVFCKKVYKISAKDPAGNRYVLVVADPVSRELNLFSDDKPEYFVQWIINQVSEGSKTSLSTKRFRLYFENPANGNRIYLVKDGMTDTDISQLRQLNSIITEER